VVAAVSELCAAVVSCPVSAADVVGATEFREVVRPPPDSASAAAAASVPRVIDSAWPVSAMVTLPS
jgi:hypothetical protein